MDKTEINLTIAGIKGLDKIVILSKTYHRLNVKDRWIEVDYLSPELNHGLVKELVVANWELFFWAGDKSYQWTDRKIHPSEQTPIVNKDYELNNCLVYIEAMK